MLSLKNLVFYLFTSRVFTLSENIIQLSENIKVQCMFIMQNYRAFKKCATIPRKLGGLAAVSEIVKLVRAKNVEKARKVGKSSLRTVVNKMSGNRAETIFPTCVGWSATCNSERRK